MGETNRKDILDEENSDNSPIPPPQEPQENAEIDEEPETAEELFTLAEYQRLDNQLDALFSALDDIENKNDNIHAQLVQLLNTNREIRNELNNSTSKSSSSDDQDVPKEEPKEK